MVLPIILFAGLIGSVIFFARGGLEQFKAFADSVVSKEDRKKGTQVIPTLQTGVGSVPIASGSQRTVNSIEEENILRTNVADKRKFAPLGNQPPIQTVFNNPIEGGVLASQRGVIVGESLSIQSGQQFGTADFGLTKTEISNIRSEDFTDQEKLDIARLTLRFNRKSVSAQKVSDAPEEIIMKKREQEAIARKILVAQGGSFTFSGGVRTRAGNIIDVKGGLFGKANFALGGKTPEEFQAQQNEKAQIEAKLLENKILNQQRKESGEQVISTIAKSALTQKQFFRERGIALTGGILSPLAIGKILERTGALVKTVRPEVQAIDPVPVQLTSTQVFRLSDAEKIARFRRGERST